MRMLITGLSGAVGAALARALDGAHELRGLARDAERVDAGPTLEVVSGDALSGEGLEAALDGVEVAFYLIHSMEPAAANSSFALRDRDAALRFAAVAGRAGVRRIVYLGGLVPSTGIRSAHLASRLDVERILLDAVPDSVALRSSVVIGARSNSFRAMVRLVERLPLIPLPPWSIHRTQPIDERDAVAYLMASAVVPEAGGRAFDIGGPDVLSYGAMLERVARSLMLARPTLALPLSIGPLESAFAAWVTGIPLELLAPLMASTATDLIADDGDARALFGVRLHGFDAAVEHALREWESAEPLRGR
jgi:uncharacterized protein YbjT (DUF2867 family)